ncbi:aminotransferase class I/II-fold pyridoxal phosphate-dependent enzyme [Pontibacillus litoralis]|uniref:Arginine decarboxylase n=1 Tax=Pontibacillus litoralis JSM 072002 TaxID=1385512 RepID=A0A0A5G079_9BACI|nr:aminotransferase class I/II-fold pyridoxal phosphate-dependent enzyme [Pontibacillus litoralis]KGX85454.1 arginine decarboxylase [Pontibacillus litoralis JSM 072002]
MDQHKTPLYHAMLQHDKKKPISFHVPGHKNGTVFPERGRAFYNDILIVDYTELTGLDDLHEPRSCILEAQRLAEQWFGALHSYFLVGGSTVGNLSMIMATHQFDRPVIVQRNCHKSVMHGLELAGAEPVFVSPIYERDVQRYGSVSVEGVLEAIEEHPHAGAIILTYPDYYGRTYDLLAIIEKAHSYNIPVLIDEAHGVHFSLGDPMPPSALQLGADIVVQSAHKMAPAMTMGSYLHVGSDRVNNKRVAHYLQMLQSSSPSYPIMGSLDLARYFMATEGARCVKKSLPFIQLFRESLSHSKVWSVLPYRLGVDDPFKVTIQMNDYDAQDVARLFEEEGLYPELVTESQILFVLGLDFYIDMESWRKCLERIEIKAQPQQVVTHATIDKAAVSTPLYEKCALNYQDLKELETEFIAWQDAEQRIAAHHVIPYPPGIPLIMKGERITNQHIRKLHTFIQQQIHIQTNEDSIEQGIHVYIELDWIGYT